MSWFEIPLTNRKWLSDSTFELTFGRPSKFNYMPGQRIRLAHDATVRDYSLVSTPQDPELSICVRHVASGRLTPLLAEIEPGRTVQASGPFGYFNWYASSNPAIFVATGTGVAPFVAFVRSGVRPHLLLHGVINITELYYRDELAHAANTYVPCLSASAPQASLREAAFVGRVTTYLDRRLDHGRYDFYVCGRGEMIRDVTYLVDRLFPGSKVYSERFY